MKKKQKRYLIDGTQVNVRNRDLINDICSSILLTENRKMSSKELFEQFNEVVSNDFISLTDFRTNISYLANRNLCSPITPCDNENGYYYSVSEANSKLDYETLSTAIGEFYELTFDTMKNCANDHFSKGVVHRWFKAIAKTNGLDRHGEPISAVSHSYLHRLWNNERKANLTLESLFHLSAALPNIEIVIQINKEGAEIAQLSSHELRNLSIGGITK